MTPAELQELVTSVEAPDTVSTLNNGFYTLTPDELLALCHRVQAQALRETAEWFASEWQKDDPAVYRLNRMADELENQK